MTDIHGNELALQAVLNEIDAISEVQEIWCLGDMIAMGPDTNEVLDILFERSDVRMITGNHDEAVLSLVLGEGHPDSYKHTREHHEWIANQLSRENIERIQQLPRILTKKINGTTLFGIHYHIEAHLREAPIKEEPFYSILEPTLENVEKMFGDYPADIICFGHNHPKHLFQTDKRYS